MIKKKVSLLIIFVLMFSLTASSCVSKMEKEQRGIDYLIQFEKNDNIIYVDDIYIHTKEKKIKKSEIDLLENSRILFVSKSNIYYVKTPKKDFCEIYKTDYECHSADKIFETNYSSIYMTNQDTIVYCNNGDIFVYHIESEDLEQYEGEDVYDLVRDNDYYSWKRHDVHLFKNRYEFCITKNATQETKIIGEERLKDLLKLEQPNYLNDLLGINFNKLKLDEDKIYVQCVSGGFPEVIVTTYLFDFESEAFTFVDWEQIYDTEDYITCFN